MIRHTVVFSLKTGIKPAEEESFFEAARKLSAIDGVRRFECLTQTGKKNNFEFGLSMEFDTQESYDNYTKNTAHVAFVEMYWVKYVKEFLEIDYQPLIEK